MIKVFGAKTSIYWHVAISVLSLLIAEITFLSPCYAKERPNVHVLTLEIKNIYKGSDEGACIGWNLSKQDVETYFKTAEPFPFSSDINRFDIYNCEVSGELIFNDVKRKYSINLGGSAYLYGLGTEQQGYGCTQGECLKYVDYTPYEED